MVFLRRKAGHSQTLALALAPGPVTRTALRAAAWDQHPSLQAQHAHTASAEQSVAMAPRTRRAAAAAVVPATFDSLPDPLVLDIFSRIDDAKKR